MKPSRLIDTYLTLRATLTGQSATGYQLERLRLNLPSGGNPDSQEEQRAYFSHLAYAIERLSEIEKQVVFAMRTPRQHSKSPDGEPCTYTDEPLKGCTCGAVMAYEREVRTGDLVVRERDGERTQETYAGEVYQRPARDREGEPRVGFVVVLGARPAFPTRESVAELLGLEFGAVKRLIRTAYGKLETAFAIDE